MEGDRLLALALSFPETLAGVAGQPLLVAADEFQALLGLTRLAPFDAGKRKTEAQAREQFLGVVRAHLERPHHVGWVITGSSVRLLTDLLDRGPLMGRFDIEHVRAFDQADCAELAVAIWDEEDVQAVPAAVDRVYRLTGGHPFYGDVACRGAASIARRLGGPVTADIVDAAFGVAVGQPNGQVYIACKEMYDSLRERTPPLGGFLDALAIEQPARVADIADRLGVTAGPSLYRTADGLKLMDVIAETPGGYTFVDPMFRFWVARANDPATTVSVPGDLRSAERLARRFEEAYLRERAMHGHLSEGFIRNLCRSFSGQQVEGRRFGLPGRHVRLPVVRDVSSVQATDPTGAAPPALPEAGGRSRVSACTGDADRWQNCADFLR